MYNVGIAQRMMIGVCRSKLGDNFTPMLIFPNCKINLGLYITNKRDDGYHDLETIFYPVPGLKDALEVVSATSGETKLHLSGKAVHSSTDSNLVWKAYKLLEQRFPTLASPVDIHLHKAIPMGAGMGGGSADGAFMLRLLNDYWRLGLAEEELLELALKLGSDCPFFIHNTPQYANGRGEMMEPIAIDLSSYSIQVICPQVHISTAKAFEGINPKPASFDLRNLPQLAVKDWKDTVHNDFEKPVFEQYPQLRDIKKQLYNGGAMYASLTGSGSAIYGLFPKGQRAVVSAGVEVEEWWME